MIADAIGTQLQAGLAINLGSAWALYRTDRNNLNVRGASVHLLADALGSVGAIVAAVLLSQGVASADAVVSLFIAALVFYGTWGLRKFMGREYMGIGRSTFVIDKQGKLVEVNYKVKAKGHAQAMLELVQNL